MQIENISRMVYSKFVTVVLLGIKLLILNKNSICLKTGFDEKKKDFHIFTSSVMV